MTTKTFIEELEKDYYKFKEKNLVNRRFKHKDIVDLINKINQHPLFKIAEAGKSTEGREIYLIKAGNGKLKILLWSQMHGNEPTATAALFDLFNFLVSGSFQNEVNNILDRISLYFIPMVNPDGTQVFKRRNAFDIDLNRDALRLEAVETQILKKIRDDINPDYGFNLHDQEIYYTAGLAALPATISFLTPSFNNAKDIDDSRIASMKMIVLMNNILQKYIPGMIGRYSDDFMPNAFGDNMQKWGTSTILIESGGYKNDPEKQVVRKMNFLSIMAALNELALDTPSKIDYLEYFGIPENKKEKLFDLLVRNASLNINNHHYKIDIGIRRKEIDNLDFKEFSISGEIAEIGDLSHYFGYEEIDANHLQISSKQKYLLIGSVADFNLIDNNDAIVHQIENGFKIN